MIIKLIKLWANIITLVFLWKIGEFFVTKGGSSPFLFILGK